MRGFVEAGAAELDTGAIDPFAHHFQRNFAWAHDCARFLIDLTFGFETAHHAARAVNGAVERVSRGFVFGAFENNARFTHGAADEAFLPREGGRGSFADDPVIFAAVRFAPCEVVMVVNLFD